MFKEKKDIFKVCITDFLSASFIVVAVIATTIVFAIASRRRHFGFETKLPLQFHKNFTKKIIDEPFFVNMRTCSFVKTDLFSIIRIYDLS